MLVVRHGATEWSRAGRHTGLTDLPLDEGGREEAVRLGDLLRERLAGVEPVVVCSPLRRAVETAELALPGSPITIVEALREVDYGSYEGRTTAEITASEPGWELFAGGTPDGEGLAQVVARCDAVIAKLERTAAGRTVVAVTHGHVGRVLVARLLGLPGSVAATLYHDTGSLGIVERRRGANVLSSWNVRPT